MKHSKFKLKKRWLLTALAIALIASELFYFSIRRFEILVQEIVWDKTHEDLNDLRIVFISDLHFGFSMNEDQFNDVINWVNKLDADILLFGGDLFDHPATLLPDQSMQQLVSNGLSRMNASIAKIAVLGNHDHESILTATMTSQVLQDGGFNVLVNQMQRLEIGLGALQIVGIDSGILGKPNIERSLALVNEEELVIVLTHTPDTASRLPSQKVDWQLSGHSHGGQIALPWIGPIVTQPDAREFTHGTYDVNNIRLDVTNGLGTTGVKARFFANPSIHLFILK
jgi:predicted MPP superfamily phosphohydrolase